MQGPTLLSRISPLVLLSSSFSTTISITSTLSSPASTIGPPRHAKLLCPHPQELTPGTVTVDWVGAVSADGKAYEGLKVTTSDLEIVLYLDTNHRLMRSKCPPPKSSSSANNP